MLKPSHARSVAGLWLALGLSYLPLAGQVAVVGPTVREMRVQPGEDLSGTLLIRNGAATTQEVRVVIQDYLPDRGGAAFEAPGTHARSNASWIHFAPSQFVLGPGEQASVEYEIAVPMDAVSQAGTYWSALIVEGSALAPSDAPTAESGLTIRTRIRHAVQIATTIAPGEVHDLAISGVRTGRDESGTAALGLDLTNTGTAGYRPVVRLQLFTGSGEPGPPLEATRGLLYPGMGLRQEFGLGALAPGRYHAFLTIDTSGDEVFGAQFEVEF